MSSIFTGGVMPWVLIVLTSVISLVIGFLAGRFIQGSNNNNQKLSYQLNNAQQELQNYKRDVSEHLLATKSILKQAQDNYLLLVEQMESTNKLIHHEKRKAEAPPQPYNGQKSTTEKHQPKDYAKTQHGLIKQFDTKKGV